MSSEKTGGEQKFSAYDHLKKEAAKKSTKKATSAGTPAIMKVFFIGIILFGALMFSGVLTNDPFNTGTDDGNSAPLGGGGSDGNTYDLASQCVNHDSAGLAAHYHYEVEIYIDNQPEEIPANIGIEGECMRPMHTHSSTGKVHVELPGNYEGGNPALGLFFNIWGYPISTTTLLGQTGDVTMNLNGNNFSSNPASYPPANGDVIQLYLTTS